jgi:hypothetical protein
MMFDLLRLLRVVPPTETGFLAWRPPCGLRERNGGSASRKRAVRAAELAAAINLYHDDAAYAQMIVEYARRTPPMHRICRRGAVAAMCRYIRPPRGRSFRERSFKVIHACRLGAASSTRSPAKPSR